MSQWTLVLSQALLVMLSMMALLRMNKALRAKRGALTQILNLDDLLILGALSLAGSAVSVLGSAGLKIATGTLLGLYGLLVWVDALLFVQYRIEVNRQTLSWCLTGHKGLAKGIPHLLQVFAKFPLGRLIPLLWPTLLVAWLTPLPWFVLLACCVIITTIAAISLMPLNHRSQWLASLLCVVVVLGLGESGLARIEPAWLAFMAVPMFSGMALLALLRPWLSTEHAFFSAPSLLGNIVQDDSFTLEKAIPLKPEHETFVSPPADKQRKSPLFGQCAGANVILITLESLGAYINPYTEDGARSRLVNRFTQNSWLSRQHFCLCPNTTVSTNQIYTGAYSNNPYNKDDSLFPGQAPKHIEALKRAGYKTFFLDSADIGLYDYHKLLRRIGFDHIWGSKDLPAKGLKADYRLWNMVDPLAELIGDQPFFLHLINDQTHMPYEVVDKARFNRHKGKEGKATYLNAVEEVDFILDEFLTRLGQKLDLSNTILVFTGDHGESFGEYGYSFHSNSVIRPQMQVPFMLHHPALVSKTIEHSCHFDLFPTFFDLLGIDYPHEAIGTSLAFDDRPFAYLFHSATLKGNTPANFGFLYNGEMVWVDRLFNQVSRMSADTSRKSPVQAETQYIKTLLFKMLESRKILYQG